MAIPSINPVWTALNDDGTVSSGALLYTYQAGSSTELATYVDGSLSTAHANPIVFNDAGRSSSDGSTEAPIYFQNTSYKLVLKDADGVTLWTIDNYDPSDANGTVSASTIAALRALTGGGAAFAFVFGVTAAGDGDAGMFRWDATSSATDDGFDVIQPTGTAGMGRWLRTGMQENTGSNPLGELKPSTIFASTREHYWIGNIWASNYSGSNRLWLPIVHSYGHSAVEGGILQLYYSEDGGNRWRRGPVISRDKDTEPRFVVSGAMYNGRQGVLFCELNNSDSIVSYCFVYSDDDFATFTTNTVTPGGNGIQFYGQLVAYPAAAGGSDTGGFMAFGYSNSPADIVYLSTTDNGANWSLGTAIDHSALSAELQALFPAGFTEASVFPITAGSRYGLVCRDRDASVTGGASSLYPVIASTSSNLTTWGNPVQVTGLALGNNPVFGMCPEGYSGRIHIYACARSGYEIDGLENKLLVANVSAADFYDNGGDLTNAPSWSIANDFAEDFTGYINWTTDESGRTFAVCQGGESLNGDANASGGQVYLLTPYSPAYATVGAVQAMIPGQNLIPNPLFNSWSLGTTFNTINNSETADRWTYIDGDAGSTDNVSRVEIDADLRKLIPGNPLYALRTDVNGSSGKINTLRTTWEGREWISVLANGELAVQVYLGGSVPDTFTAEIGFNFGTGGSPTATKTASVQLTKLQTSGDGIRYMAGIIPAPTLEASEGTAVTWGSNNDEYAYLDIKSNSYGYEADWYAVKLERGDQYTEIEPEDPDVANAAIFPVPAAAWKIFQDLAGTPVLNNLKIAASGVFGTDASFLQMRVNGANNYGVDASFFYCNQGLKLGHYGGSGSLWVNGTQVVGAQQTTGVAEAAFVENSGGTAVNVDSTFGGYTLQQVVQALQNHGLLA